MIKPMFTISAQEEKLNYARFVLEPLEQGYGHTLGNALRRCLLSSISGAAITKVKIDGVRHQFTTLEGMKEDMVEFILNLKQVRVAYQGDKEVKMVLEASGPKKVTAGDIQAPAEVKIVNKDLVLANLADKKSKLKVEMWVAAGYGYSLAEERKTNVLGLIPVDALFSPVIKVNYKVEATRVGGRTDYDRLILEIWTDGTVKPRAALEEAAKILENFFRQVYRPEIKETKEKKEETAISYSSKDNEVLELTVEELNLPTRITNALRRGGFSTVKELLRAKPEDLAKVKNLGVKSIDLIKGKLKEKGFSFE